MEPIILGTLGYLGDNINKKKKIEPSKCKLKHKNYGKKVYNTSISKKINRTTEKQAKKVKETGFASQFDTLMLDNVGGPVSMNQSNVIKRDGVNSFDISLQRDIDFNNDYSEFGKTQMHYNVVPQIEMMTSNMHPHSSKRDLTNYNKDYSHQLSLHTGVDPFYKSKDNFDPVNIFEPMKDLTYVHGAPVMTDLLEQRYVPSMKNNFGDLPFQNKLKVQPGIDGQVQDGLHAVYRIMPKTTEELRSKTNQKISYKADKIESGKRGEARSASHNLTKYKLPTHREREINDYLPNAGIVNKEKQTGEFKKINTHRSTSMNVLGHAHDSTQGTKKDGKVVESSKITYANDAISRAVSNVTTKPVLQNKKSYRNVENERNSTNHNIHGGAHNVNEGSYALDPKDIPLTTLRQLMIDGDTNIGVTNNNGNSYVFSKDFVIPVNNRNTTTHNMNDGNIVVENTQGYILDKNDKAKRTIRQTTENFTVTGALNPEHREAYQYNEDDLARPTVRQTTSSFTVTGALNPEHKEGHYYNQYDVARRTIGETTSNLTVTGALNPEHKEGHYFNEHDHARRTIKQTTEHMNVTGTVNPQLREGHYYDKDNVARDTIRQTTEFTQHSGNVNPQHKESNYYNSKDKARKTVKQTTEHMTVEGGVNPMGGGPNYINYNDRPDNTIRDMTTHSNYVSNTARPQGNNPYMYNEKNKARPTIKSKTLFTAPEKNISLSSYGNVLRLTDNPRTTIKETTIHTTQGGRLGNETGTVGYARDIDDTAKKTIKQTTLHSTQGGRLGNETGTVGYSRDLTDKAKPTIKQSTLHSTQGGRLGNENGGVGYARDLEDKAKTTIKQTTLHSTQGGRLGRSDAGKGYSKDKNDKARVTIKQTTLLQNHTGALKSEVDKQRSYNAEENMTIDERREILTYNRPAGPKSDLVGPVMTKRNVKLKDENFLKRDNYGYDQTNCNMNQLNKVYTRNKDLLNNPSYRLSTDFINTLGNNPLVNDLMHQKNN